MTYGYAASSNPEALQFQAEALEDAGVPSERQFTDLLKYGQSERESFNALVKTSKRGDTIVIYDLSVLGFDLQESFERLKALEQKKIRLEVCILPEGESQEGTLSALRYLAGLFDKQREQGFVKGHPQKKYPPGWRAAYLAFKKRQKTAVEICAELGIPTYDFYRMLHRYENAVADRHKNKKRK